MSDPLRPTLPELARQALSSVQRGYDLLAPKFDHTRYRTPDSVLDATARALKTLGPFTDGLDLCCGTGAGIRVLHEVCSGQTAGLDFSTGMLTEARYRYATAPGFGPHWVRGDALAPPFRPGTFDLVVSFGAFGHFLPAERTPDGEAARKDDEFAYVAAWEFTGVGEPPVLHKEALHFEYVHPTQRSYT